MEDSGFKGRMVKVPSINTCRAEATAFSQKSHHFFNQVIFGAIDVKEVRIRQPAEDCEAYYNRKQFYSIKLQVVSGSSTRILDYFVGWPGSANDARTFSNSPIFNLLQAGTFNNYKLLGDSAYPCNNFLLTPYKGRNLTGAQRRFNVELSRLRQVVERTFGIMSRRWSCINYVNSSDIGNICRIVEAICCMQNFSLDFNEH
jgi:hypothetical protein